MLVRALLITVSGLGLAAGGVLTTVHVLGKQEPVAAAPAPAIETTTVVVANRDIAFGVEVQPSMVTLQPWPSHLVPPNAFTALDQVVGTPQTGLRRAKRAIVAGEPLLPAKLSEFGEKVTIAHVIDPAKRALSIRVDDVSGVSGFVTPGDRVDVVLTQQDNGDTVASTILQDVLVRGVDQISDQDSKNPTVVRTVTVEVFPDQAQKLVLAQNAGRLSLTLRPAGTHDEVVTPTMTRNSLTNLTRNEITDLATTGPSVTIRRGAAEEVVPVVR